MSDAAKAIRAFRAKIDTIGGNAGIAARRPPPNFFDLNARFVGQLTAQDNADQAPTEAMIDANVVACHDLRTAVANWATAGGKALTDLNAALRNGGQQPLSALAAITLPQCAEKAAR
jgi:hypothetical protein